MGTTIEIDLDDYITRTIDIDIDNYIDEISTEYLEEILEQRGYDPYRVQKKCILEGEFKLSEKEQYAAVQNILGFNGMASLQDIVETLEKIHNKI